MPTNPARQTAEKIVGEVTENFTPVCNDEAHHPAWCSRCENMRDGAEQLGSSLTDAITAAIEAARPQWQPIETAPTNQAILIYLPGWEHYGPSVYRAIQVDMGTGRRWHTSAWAYGRDLAPGYGTPTHWMPLPEPPALNPPTTEQSNG